MDVVPQMFFPYTVCVGEEIFLGRKLPFFAKHVSWMLEPHINAMFAPGRLCAQFTFCVPKHQSY